jgi:hypothetical protein
MVSITTAGGTEHMTKKLVQVKLDSDLVKQVDIRAVQEDAHRGEVMEHLLRRGLEVTQGSGAGAGKAQRLD